MTDALRIAEPGWQGFAAAAEALGATAALDDLQAAAQRVLLAWNDPARGYHDLEHLSEVLARLTELGALDAEPLEPEQVAAAQLAAWFHDVVYTGAVGSRGAGAPPDPGADERASAARAATTLAHLGVPDQRARQVARLVLVTIDHRPVPGDRAAARLCDADLAILAASPGRYARYRAGVRRDFAHVGDADFARGRAAVVRSLLRRSEFGPDAACALYRCPGTMGWAARARANLAAELAGLEAG